MDRDRQIALMQAVEERTAEYVRRWLENPEFRRALHRYDRVRELDQSEGGGFLAEIPDLPGCMADGETIEDAVARVHEAATDWIAAAIRHGRCSPA